MLLRNSAITSEPALDLTPVIDMVFLLLIFFLAATTFQQVERELNIALPQTRAAGPVSAALREIVINIDADGQIVVGGQAMAEQELAALLGSRIAINRDQKVIVRGDRSTVYANVARVLDVCKGAGVAEPFLETTSLR
ncbi:MAG: biopolymer transporter ExbD [Phycisphaerales bacterium]|jgi:biopolymer transport protein ExbD